MNATRISVKKILLIIITGICLATVSCGKNLTGEYYCSGGLVGSLEFSEGKNVVLKVMGMEFPSTYRYESGYIYIKHDKGGEFSYKMLNDKELKGTDGWNKKAKCLKKEAEKGQK